MSQAAQRVEAEPLHALAPFQSASRDALRDAVRAVAGLQSTSPAHREAIGREQGVMLLQSPTGSGKTLVLGRTLESLRGAVLGRFVWFWFAPFFGLVGQTKDALAAQCPSLRLRDIATDRTVAGSRDGDVYIQTWATVAANNADARKVRRQAEDTLSIDDLIAELRDRDFLIGVVIDEAHLNFGTSAKAAASFYTGVLKPDVTILATATPNDEKLADFEKEAGIRVVENRVTISRRDVVDAGLNKVGLYLGLVRFSEADSRLVDPEQAALKAGWRQHVRIRDDLAARGIAVTPLMLVQVEDQARGEADPVARVREKLHQLGVPALAIRAHTSGKPDPDFHALAWAPDVEVLIFKVAVATGFDAPRAWTLVSVRPARGVEFGLQIVGRIMRVHPAVRHLHKTDPLLDYGYVFLTDPEIQGGLDAAVSELKAVRSSIELITDRLNVVQFGSGALLLPDAVHRPAAATPLSESERIRRIGDLVEQGILKGTIYDEPVDYQERVLQAAESGISGDLWGDLPLSLAPDRHLSVAPAGRGHSYRLQTDLGMPDALLREELPPIHEIDADFADRAAQAFIRQITVADYLLPRGMSGRLNFREMFEGRQEVETLAVPISAARAADLAQVAFEFNDRIDPRDLKRALVRALRAEAERRAFDIDEQGLRRAVDLAGIEKGHLLKDAVREAQRHHIRVTDGDPVPPILFDEPGLEPARKGAYGVFPSGMNGPEGAFARFLDREASGSVLWWLRCVENTRWAAKLVLPDGRNFFPDFAVGVSRRSKRDGIALVEIKDDGRDGRLHSDVNRVKSRVEHQAYGRVFWATRHGEDLFARMVFDPSLNLLRLQGAFDLKDLILD